MLTKSVRACWFAFSFAAIPLELELEPDFCFIADIVFAKSLQLSPLIFATNLLAAVVAILSAICWRICCATPGSAVAATTSHAIRKMPKQRGKTEVNSIKTSSCAPHNSARREANPGRVPSAQVGAESVNGVTPSNPQAPS